MKKHSLLKSASGFTLMETLAAIFVAIIVIQGTLTLYMYAIDNNSALSGNLNAQADVRRAFTLMIADIRSASPSASGAYTIDTASSTYFAYYSDVDGDALKEKIRYFLSNKILKVGIIKPSGSPLTYNIANEKISNLISDVVNASSTPIFSYYNSSYNGTSSPMSYPISIPAVRLIKIKVLIDHDPKRPPAAIEFSTQVSIRNLKDNL
jgi:type II secretory pathway component PulJ